MYYTYEHQIKADGSANIIAAISRSSFALGLSYYYERCSKMVANTEFVSVHIMLVDEKLAIVKKDDLTTAYVAPEE